MKPHRPLAFHMDINEIVKPESVLCNAEAGSKKHAIEILSKMLARADASLSPEEIFSCLIERERLGCTALGAGTAIPHARFDEATTPIGALIQLTEPVEFDTPDDEPVDLIFGLIVPADIADEEADSFKAIMQRFRDPDYQAKLREARSSRELYDALRDYDAEPDTRVVSGAR